VACRDCLPMGPCNARHAWSLDPVFASLFFGFCWALPRRWALAAMTTTIVQTEPVCATRGSRVTSIALPHRARSPARATTTRARALAPTAIVRAVTTAVARFGAGAHRATSNVMGHPAAAPARTVTVAAVSAVLARFRAWHRPATSPARVTIRVASAVAPTEAAPAPQAVSAPSPASITTAVSFVKRVRAARSAALTARLARRAARSSAKRGAWSRARTEAWRAADLARAKHRPV
jgi:hypothetical protein